MQRVSETRKRYGDAQTFLKLLNPGVQPLVARYPERAYMGTAPTLSVVRAAYTEEVAELWLMAQVENLNDLSGCFLACKPTSATAARSLIAISAKRSPDSAMPPARLPRPAPSPTPNTAN